MTDTPNDGASDKDANLEQMRKKADRADALEAELTQLRKREAFREAGIGFTEGPGKLVFDTFNAEEINSGAVAEYAAAYGVTPGSTESAPAAETTEAAPQELAEQEFFASTSPASMGGEPTGESLDGVEASRRAFDAERKSGSRIEKAAQAGIGEIMKAASKGDRKVVYNQDEWRERNRA